MTENPFGFLLGLSDTQGKEWLRRFLKGEAPDPAVRVPFDLQPLEFLLGRVNPLPDPVLPLRVGTLAGTLLAEAVARGAQRTEDPTEIEALFTLVESLPVSQDVADFLNDLAVTGRLVTNQAGPRPDLHLLTLRALVLHQRPVQGEIEGLLDFWKRKLKDTKYAPIAMQGLLRISVSTAISSLPEFVRLARTANPPIPLANTLFAVSVELGADPLLWDDLVRAFAGWEDELDVVRETFGKTRLPESNPPAWEALRDASPHPRQPTPFIARYLQPNDSRIRLARDRHPERLLVPQAA